MKIGDRIRYLRARAGLTQDELAKRLDVARATVASWEINKRTPDAEALKSLASVFDVTVDYLLELEEKDMLEEPNLKRLYDAVARAKDLPDENVDQAAQFLEFLIKRHEQERSAKHRQE